MNRRDLFKMIAAATGMAMVGGDLLAQGVTAADSSSVSAAFTAADIALLDDVAETILPRTDTPGAKESGAGAQIAKNISDCFTSQQRTIVKEGLLALQAACLHRYQHKFAALTPEQKHSILTELDTAAKTQMAQPSSPPAAPHYFTILKQQSIFVFFTSQVGATKALRHLPIPGRWDGNFPYKKGDRAWSL